MSGAALADDVGSPVVDDVREVLLVYRHRLGLPSEVGFLSRFYTGFERLQPFWLGYHIEPGVDALTATPLRLGRPGPFGTLDRALFRRGILPKSPDLSALRPRLVHAHFGRGGALALPIARILGIPLVVTFHGGDATKETHYRQRLVPRLYARRLRSLQREAALFVCVSEYVRDRLLARGFPPDKLEVVRQGVDIGPASRPGEASNDARILFVGRFVDKKGVRHLIEAMRILAARGVTAGLELVGDGPLAAVLREAAADVAGISFTGWLPNTEVRRRMRSASALCVPSVTAADGDAEGLPTVIFEAMAEGIPVVATRHAGIAEAVAHGDTGLLVAEADPFALADAIQRLIAQPDLRQRLGTAARTAALERFDAIRQSRQLEAALLRVSGGPPR